MPPSRCCPEQPSTIKQEPSGWWRGPSSVLWASYSVFLLRLIHCLFLCLLPSSEVVLYLSLTLPSSLDVSGSEKYDQLLCANCCRSLAGGKILITASKPYFLAFLNPNHTILVLVERYMVLMPAGRSNIGGPLCFTLLNISEMASTPKEHLKLNKIEKNLGYQSQKNQCYI